MCASPFWATRKPFRPDSATCCGKRSAATLDNTGLRLNIAINYGARAELARAARLIAQEVQAGTLNLSQVDEKAISERLYNP